MRLPSWLIGRNHIDSLRVNRLEEEKRELLSELAQKSVTFERSRHTVQEIAEQAMKSMKEGQGR